MYLDIKYQGRCLRFISTILCIRGVIVEHIDISAVVAPILQHQNRTVGNSATRVDCEAMDEI